MNHEIYFSFPVLKILVSITIIFHIIQFTKNILHFCKISVTTILTTYIFHPISFRQPWSIFHVDVKTCRQLHTKIVSSTFLDLAPNHQFIAVRWVGAVAVRSTKGWLTRSRSAPYPVLTFPSWVEAKNTQTVVSTKETFQLPPPKVPKHSEKSNAPLKPTSQDKPNTI